MVKKKKGLIEELKKELSKELNKLNLRPVALKETEKKAKNSKEKKVEKEQTLEEDLLEQQSPSRSNTSNSFLSPIETRAPVLEKQALEQSSSETLERQVRDAPRITEIEEPAKEIVYVNKAVANYSGKDYSAKSSYDLLDQDDRDVKINMEMDVTGGRIRQQSPTTFIEEPRAIRLGAWQREHIASQGMTIDSSPERQYQVLSKKNKKEKTGLPFQE